MFLYLYKEINMIKINHYIIIFRISKILVIYFKRYI